MLTTQKFTHNAKTYEIRIMCDGETVYVKAFCENRPANAFRYSATLEGAHDFSLITEMDAVKHLVEIAKWDVIDGRR